MLNLHEPDDARRIPEMLNLHEPCGKIPGYILNLHFTR
jgi:hypothetical protein